MLTGCDGGGAWTEAGGAAIRKAGDFDGVAAAFVQGAGEITAAVIARTPLLCGFLGESSARNRKKKVFNDTLVPYRKYLGTGTVAYSTIPCGYRTYLPD